MKRLSLFLFIKPHAVIALLLWAVPLLSSAAAQNGPVLVIQHIEEQMRRVFDQSKLDEDPSYIFRLANDILVPNIDFGRVSGLALGKHWRKATPVQRSDFARQFQRLLVRAYAAAFNEFMDWEIQYLPLRANVSVRDVSVHTQVLRSDAQPVRVVYRMHRLGEQWKAYDVKIEGVSLVTNYRHRFSREVRQGGVDGLIQLLRQINDKRAGDGMAVLAD